MINSLRITRLFEYVVGYIGLSSIALGLLEALEGNAEPNELWVWPLIGVVIPAVLGVAAGLTDTAAGSFSYWPLVVGSVLVDLAAMIRYRLAPGWVTSNLRWLIPLNLVAIAASCAAAWLVRRAIGPRTPESAAVDATARL